MGLLAPLFLLGLLAVAAPVLIHLRLRHRSQVVQFPSLMFVSKAPFRSTRRRRLRDLLLLLLRCAAVALLALAFARPFLVASPAAGESDSNRLVVVLLDNSFSMGFGDRWQGAVEAAEVALGDLGVADRGALIAYSDQAEILAQPTADSATLVALLRDVELSPRATALLPAVQAARGVLAQAADAERELVIVSDFQRSSWTPDNVAALPPGVELTLVDVGAEDGAAGNAAVTDLVFDHTRAPTGGGGEAAEREQVAVAARVSYRVAADVDVDTDGVAEHSLRGEIDLLLNREVVQTRAVELAPDSSTTVSFAPEVLEQGRTTRGAVRLRTDPLTVDNEFHFVLSPAHGVGVLVVEPDGDRRRGRYIEEALALGRRPRFRVRRVGAAGFEPSLLDGTSVVVLNDAAEQLSTSASEALVGFVRRGGGLLLAVERGMTSTSPLLRELGVTSEQRVDRTAGVAGSLAWFDTGHPVFDVFAGARSGDFSSASFFRYHRLLSDEDAAAIARFDDGSPALIDLFPGTGREGGGEGGAASVASGRALVLPTSFDTFWNTLPLQSVFLPFVHRSVEYLAGYSLPRSWYRVGEVAQVELPGLPTEAEGYLSVAPSGRERRLDASADSVLLDVEEPGFYSFRELRGDVAEAPLTLAANVPVAESDLGRLDLDELGSRIRPSAEAEEAAEAAAQSTPEERQSRQRMWWFLIAAAALVLAAETLFGNRRRRVAAPVVTAWRATGEQG